MFKFLLILSSFPFYCAFGQIEIEGLTNFENAIENVSSLKLKGEIVSYLETSHHGVLKDGVYEKTVKGWRYDSQFDTECFFDSLGNLIEEKICENSKDTRHNYYKYNQRNKIVEINDQYQTIYFEYDSLNRIKGSKEIRKKADPLSIDLGENKKSGTSWFEYYYNSDDQLIERIETDKRGKKISNEIYEYDRMGNLILKKTQNVEGYQTFELSYNSENQLKKYIRVSSLDEFYEYTEYTYKSDDIILEHWVFTDGEITISNDFQYEGNLLSSITETDFDNIVTREEINYEFDKKGNWIKCVHTTKDDIFIEERQIIYK